MRNDFCHEPRLDEPFVPQSLTLEMDEAYKHAHAVIADAKAALQCDDDVTLCSPKTHDGLRYVSSVIVYLEDIGIDETGAEYAEAVVQKMEAMAKRMREILTIPRADS